MTGSSRFVTSSGRLLAPWRLLLFFALLVSASIPVWAIGNPTLRVVLRVLGAQTGPESIVLVLGAALAHLVMLRLVDRSDWNTVGLGRANAQPRPLAFSFAVSALAIGIPVAVLVAASELRIISDPFGGWRLLIERTLLILIPAALWEEMLSRGYAFAVLDEWLGPLAALTLTSVAFGLLHLLNPFAGAQSIAVVIVAGFFLGVVRLRTGSVWASFAAHVAWNAVLVVGLHAVLSGDRSFPTPGWRVQDEGPSWLTGGRWGPEGGAAAAIGMLVAIGLILRVPGFRPPVIRTAESHSPVLEP